MRTTRPIGKTFVAWVLIFLMHSQNAFCAGVITNASQAALTKAMAGGGTVTLAFDGTIWLTNTIIVATNTALDGTGHNAIVSGSNSVPMFVVPQGSSFCLTNITLADGAAFGSTYAATFALTNAAGGAICSTGIVCAVQCCFTNNTAFGQIGDVASSGFGGAIYNAGSLTLIGSRFVRNLAIGGDTLNWPFFPAFSSIAAPGSGGAVYNSGNAVIQNCLFLSNTATGGSGVPAFAGNTTGASGAAANGGAIFNSNTISISNAIFRGNSCIGGTGGDGAVLFGTIPPWSGGSGGSANGGAVSSQGGSVLIGNSALVNNWANAGAGGAGGGGSSGGSGGPGASGGQAVGGAISITAGLVEMVNCTLVSNNIVAGAGGAGGGGGGGGRFENGGGGGSGANGGVAAGGAVGLLGGMFCGTNLTFANNAAMGGAAGNSGPAGPPGSGAGTGGAGASGLPGSAEGATLGLVQGSLTLINSILSCAPGETNVFGSIIDYGYNFNSDTTLTLTNVWSLNDLDPGIGPLGYYGGPTPTIPLLAGSPAIDAGDPDSFPSTDQRGRPRPYGDAPDIGAFESSPPYVISGNVAGLVDSTSATIEAGTNNAVTDANGDYTIVGVEPGAYIVTPQNQKYQFTPATAETTVTGDMFGINFMASPAMSLNLASLNNGVLEFQIVGRAGENCQLQSSSDLVHWTISTNAILSSNEVQIALPTNGPVHFYRVLSQ